MYKVVCIPADSTTEKNLEWYKKEFVRLKEQGIIQPIPHYLFDYAQSYYDKKFVRNTKYYSNSLNAYFHVKHYSDFGKEDLYFWSCCDSTSPKFHHHYLNFVPIKHKKE